MPFNRWLRMIERLFILTRIYGIEPLSPDPSMYIMGYNSSNSVPECHTLCQTISDNHISTHSYESLIDLSGSINHKISFD